MKTKTVVLCVSEMSPILVEKWSAIGALPNITRLMRRGAIGRTRHEVPVYLTPQLWATITTGVSAGEHGVFDYYQRAPPEGFVETNASTLKVPRFWDQMAESGIRPGIINVPLTYPPRLARGFMISGQDAPGDHASIATPESLLTDIRTRFGRYHLKDVFPGGQDKKSYAGILRSEGRRQTSVFEAIAARKDWDFLMLYTSGVAMAQHYFWSHLEDDLPGDPYRDTVKEAFVAVDNMLGALVSQIGENTNFLVVSECGAGALAKGVNLNAYLQRCGLLSLKPTGSAFRTHWRVERDLLSFIRTKAQRHLPKRFFYWANRMRVKKWLQNRVATGSIDWAHTRVYHRGKGEGNIYFNMVGREENGIVGVSERAALANQVEARLLELIDDSGIHPVVAVHRREKLYSGPFLESAPDMIIEWRDCAYMPTERNSETCTIFGPRWREYMNWPTTGSHRPHGFFAAAGPIIPSRRDICDLGLLDLAPTWLALCGLRAPVGMKGRPRYDVIGRPADGQGINAAILEK